jgi:biotin transport system substrate-specific component
MKIRDMTFISLFIALMAAGAFFKIPLPFLNITFQGFFAVIAGPLLGPGKGALAMVLYMLLGLAGLPLFSGGGGLGYVLAPSFGFIPGFILGAVVSGLYYGKSVKSYFNAAISSAAGMAAIYLAGVPYMFAILKFYIGKPGITITAVVSSMVIYIIKDIVLCFPAAAVIRYPGLVKR